MVRESKEREEDGEMSKERKEDGEMKRGRWQEPRERDEQGQTGGAM